MGRLLFLLLLLAALAAVVWRVLRALAPPREPPPPRFEPTSRCTRCGTHVPVAQLDADGLCTHCRTAP